MASIHFSDRPIDKKLLTYMPLCRRIYSKVIPKPAASQPGSAFFIFGIISTNSFRSLRKKINASKIISTASISLQYNLGENNWNFLLKANICRFFFAVKIYKQKMVGRIPILSFNVQDSFRQPLTNLSRD
jgi:hypothetical protein